MQYANPSMNIITNYKDSMNTEQQNYIITELHGTSSTTAYEHDGK